MKRPILVTGSHRSGTTWIGKVLSADPEVAYIHEPFLLTSRPGVLRYRVPYWYYAVPDPPPPELVDAYSDLLHFRYSVGAEVRALRSLKDVARMVRDFSRFMVCRVRDKRPLIKDPLALLSAEWLAHQFNAAVLVSIRHPLAFVSSLVRLGWRFDYADLENQPHLMATLLRDSTEDIEAGRRSGGDAVIEAAYVWKILHRVIARYREEHPEWIFVRYEDLARNPVVQFEGLYARLDLAYGPSVRERIDYLSGDTNPAERPNDPRVTRVASAAHAKGALRRLSEEDRQKIRDVVTPVSRLFYADDEW